MEENECNVTKAIKKRQSLRRSLAISGQPMLSIIPELSNTSLPEENSNTNYISSLLKEEKEWKKEYKRRCAELKKLTAELNFAQLKGVELDLSLLSEDQQKFLNDKIDFEDYMKIDEQLQESAMKALVATEEINHLLQQTSDIAKQNINTLTQYYIKKL